jgi:4'-phosphopantetheinyl transferase
MQGLSTDHVHIVRLASENVGYAPTLRCILDDNERARAERFVSELDRRRFVVAHAQMRIVIAAFLHVPPVAIRFSVGSHGKPQLSDRRIDLRFSLSHSGEQALLALAIGREVGIDIEQVRSVEVLDLARHCFSQREYETLESFSPDQRLQAFFRGWTRKESLVKARGDGLSCSLRDFDVSLDETARDLLVGWRLSPNECGRWTMRSVAADAGYAAAITVEGQGWRLVDWHL